jgi:uncharacterized peroxidase-related enzyme
LSSDKRFGQAGDADLLDPKQFVEGLQSDYRSVALTETDRAMLDYAFKLTEQPGQIVRDDVEQLRLKGFDDLAIHDLVCCVAYFAFVNRIADGLGVELEG